MLTSSDLTYMRDTEETAMASAGIVYRATFTSTPLGNQTEAWTQVNQSQQFLLSTYLYALLRESNYIIL